MSFDRKTKSAFVALRGLAIALATVIFAGSSHAQTTPVKIGSLDLSIGGVKATVSPANPTIPKNIASGVQIVVTQNGQQLTAAQVAQYLGGPFQLVGQYSGPGLTQTVNVPPSAAPNSLVLDLPAVTTAGNYTLSNVQFVVNSAPVFDVTPSTIPIQVINQVLVTSVQTTPLTLDQIQQAGVVLDASAYTGFQFTVGLAFQSQVVNVTFPVVFDPQGVPIPQPLSPPQINSATGVGVPIPATIVPVLLQGTDPVTGGGVPLPDLGNGKGQVKIPSIIVIPGNVGYLKQFFSAQLYVSNGAPSGSNLTVDNVTGTISLPPGADGVVGTSDDPLALPNLTSGAQSPTMNVLAPPPGGGTPSIGTLNPGDTGQAEWTIRGDKEGYYTINFGINATLNGLPTGPISLTGSAMGGVLVRNPYFNMTFTVPATVRKGEQFNVYATVTNISQVAANNLTVSFDQAALSGVTLNSPQSPVVPTLNAGDSTTLTYQFTSLQTGRVVASYLNFATNNGTTGNLNFTLGVYGNGTPMSPDTIALPSAVDNLPTDVVDAAMRVIGQAWSVATAPALPAGVLPTTRNVVNQKALLLAEAGLRESLGELPDNALRDLGVDFFSGSPVDPGFDQVLRTTPAGENFVNVLGSHLGQPMTQAGGPLPYEAQLADIEASGPNFVTFAVGSGTGPAPVTVSLTDGAGSQITSSAPGGSIVSGALFPLGSSANGPYLGLITSPTNSPYTLLLTGQASGSADISISIPRGDGTVVRGTITGVAVAQGQQMRIVADFNNPNNLALQIDTAGNGTFATTVPLNIQVASPSGPSLISAAVIGPNFLNGASIFGVSAVALFDRVVDGTTSKNVTNYSIPNNSVASASRQLSGRMVFANLAQPEGPYVPTTFSVSGIADQRGAIGPSGSVPLQSLSQQPGVVVSGRVLNADGTPSPTAVVTYSASIGDISCHSVTPIGVASVPVQSNGAYQFRYVTQGSCGGGFQMSTKNPTTGDLRQVSGYVQAPGAQMVLDLTLLGLGSVTGTVKDLSGNPVYNAQVGVLSGTDPQIGGTTYTDVNGNYAVNGITVGPVTVKAVKGVSVGSSAGNIQRAGTAAVVNVTLNSGAVNVSGVVTLVQGGVSTSVPGAVVAYYLILPNSPGPLAAGFAKTIADGSYSIQSVPAGSYYVTAYLGNNLTATQSGVSAAGDNLVIPLQVVAASSTGTVNGKVTLPNGTPAAGVIVYYGATGVLTASDGTYSLPGVPIVPSQSQIIYARTTDYVRSGQASVVVGSSTPVSGVNITLSGLGSAQFTVLDATGKPIVGQTVTLPDGSPNCKGPSQTTDVNGIAVFSGLGLGGVNAAALQSHGNSIDLASGAAKIIQDGSTGFATLQFHGSGTVTGAVVDPSNKPAFGAIVQLTSNTVDMATCTIKPGGSQSVQTGTAGTFQFTGVNAGAVGVAASQTFFPTQVGAQGNLANGATINFPLQLVNTISGVLSGTVFLPDGVTPVGAGVQVTANGPLPNVSVTTDSSGNFRFAKIFPEGSYTLTANDPVSGGTNQVRIYLRANQDMTQNLRLLGTGTINVTVVDGAGVPVNSAFVTLTETGFPNGSFSGSLDPSNQGVLPFPNVFEGDFSVQVQDSFGRGGRASGTLPQGISSVSVQVQLTTTGSVQGHFYMPDGVTPIPNATIQLTASGRSIGQTTSLGSGNTGSYSFQYVPAGPVQLKGLDPLTGRTGIAAGTITTQGQTLTLDIKAQGLDTITGTVSSNGAPQPGANVTIVSGTFQATTIADANGVYLMTGVPEGAIVVTASLGNGFLSGTASATVSGDGNTLTLDVALRNSGTVTGQVLAADGVTPAPPSSVSIYVGGVGGGRVNTTTDSQGNFTLQNVPAGNGTISVKVLGGIDQASAQVNVPSGGTTNVQITLNGTGGVSGVALDSAGNPTAGTVVLTGTGTFPYSLTLTAASDGSFAVPQVLAGPFTVRLTANIGGFTLYGTASGTVLPSQTAKVTVQVQFSGTITASVLRPDGQTPAVGALVSIQTPGGKVTIQVQNNGAFTANGVPLGAFSVQINDPSTNGLAAIQGLSLGSNGQVVNLGTITLDANALSVVGSNPTDGATGVAVNQVLTVTFSESVASTTGISLMNGTTNVPVTSSLSTDGKTVTLQGGQLPDGVQITLNLSGQITDVFGRQLLQPQAIHFTTVDLTPPSVTSISPANGAIQVPVNSSVVVTFNKALSTTANLSSVMTLSSTAGQVSGTTTLTAANALTFTPSTSLTNNSRYNVIVVGAVSFGGNVQTGAFTSTFASPETFPPSMQLNSPANGAFVNTARPTISITLSDSLSGINTASGSMVLDGQNFAPTVGSTFLSFTPSIALADGSHSFTASVLNNAGIPASLSSSFTVDTVPPSVAILTGITAGQILKGTVSISASATDSLSGVAKINFLVDGVIRATLTAPSFSTAFDTTITADGSHNFSAQAVDNAGNSGPASAAIQAFVSNIPLTISITSPAAGAHFSTQVTVKVTTSKSVANVVFALGNQSFTVTSTPYQATFDLTSLAEGQQMITATATAVEGTVASTSVTINVDHTPPAVNRVLIAANPPSNGVSVVRGLAGAIEAGAHISIQNTTHTASASATAASDGSFSTNITGAIGDVLSLVATDSAGNSSAATTFTIPQTAPLPQVSQVTPADASTSVFLNTHVVVRFAQPVAASSIVSGTLRLLQGGTSLAGTVTLSNDGLSLTLAPAQNLAASTQFTVSVTDVANGQTSPLFQSTFTTGTTTSSVTPQVLQTNPSNGGTAVPTNTPVMLQFNEAMDPATLTTQTFQVTDNTTNQAVQGMVQVDATGLTASFVPQSSFAINRTFRVNITSGMKDLSGNSLSGGITNFSFTTASAADTQGPTLVGISPANGLTGVPTNALVVLEFDKPLDVISVSNGLQLMLNNTTVSGGIALSNGNQQLTFTPLGGLAANSTYSVVLTSQVTSIANLGVVNPGTFTFSTGSTSDTTHPSVVTVSPASGASGVPTNAVVQLVFSKAVNPLTVTSSTFRVWPASTGIPMAGTISVSTNGLTATFTPTGGLASATQYNVNRTSGITDLEGQALSNGSTTSFTTGLSAATGLTVVSVSPPNGTTGVAVNARVDVLLSAPVDVPSVGSSAIQVKAGGNPVAGTVSVSNNGQTLTFTPSSLLTVSTSYTVNVSGFTDQAGNAVTPFTSGFTTGTTGTSDTTRPSVSTVNPVNNATGVSVTSNIVLTFSEAIDPTTVNTSNIPITANSFTVAGSYAVNGNVVTFTPVSAWPGGATVRVTVNFGGVTDLAGNGTNSFSSSFTTASVVDATPPQVLMVTPSNGTTNIGLNATVTLTFSESLNPNTITGNTFGLLANGSKLSPTVSHSSDNQTVTLSATLPASSTVTVVATNGVTDLSGNALANFQSQFTTAAAFDTSHPSVVNQRPGNGATGVPLNASVLLYVNEAMNVGSIPGALHVSQNGVLVSGSVQVQDNGQTVLFTPSIPWQANSLVQVFLDSTAIDTDGATLSSYQGSFTTAADTSNVAPTVVSASPSTFTTGVPTNVVIDVGFNETLSAATVNSSTLYLTQGATTIPTTLNLIGGGTIVQIVPTAPLAANTLYFVNVTSGVLGTNGLAAASNLWWLQTGASTDTVAPTVLVVSPPNGLGNVSNNADVHVRFSKPINPLTVNGTTITLSGAGSSVPMTISFSNNNQDVMLVPYGPLPNATQMTLTVSGVTDLAGNVVVPRTTQFTTGVGPDTTIPTVVSTNPFSGATNVPLNTPIQLQANKPVDFGTVASNTFVIHDNTTGQSVAGTYSVSTDAQTITFLPSAPLAVSRQYNVSWVNDGITDLAGNLLTNISGGPSNFSFTTGTTANTTQPQVVAVSPADQLTGVPVNAQVMVQFNEPVDSLTLNQVTLSSNSGAVSVTRTLTNANQTLTLVPVAPLATNTVYTVTITGIVDLSGNTMTGPVLTTFTSSGGVDLTAPSVVTVSPASGASGVPTNAVVQLVFSKAVNPLTVTSSTFRVWPASTGIPMAGTISVSTNGLTATFTPTGGLASATQYNVNRTSGITDLEGQALSNGSTTAFTTQ